MEENALYYGKPEFYNLIRSLGGEWNDWKKRPIVCLMKLSEYDNIYWAIPKGKYSHRDEEAIARIETFLNRPEEDLRSCFYHIGRAGVKSIFFISDAFPITDEYIIEEEYPNVDPSQLYVIKNEQLISELKRKLTRILAWEDANPNYFRQHITDVKNCLIEQLHSSKSSKE